MYENYSKEELIAEIESLKKQQNIYQLSWNKNMLDEGTKALEDHLPLIIPDTSKDIINNINFPNHILINGDNVYSLSRLKLDLEGMIDAIYIDPPYNTGNDFAYNDDFKVNRDKHSGWLCFMESRLKLARDLLSDKGVIFISIDDNEQANLKLLCDQIFGEANFVSNSIIVGNPSGRSQDKYVAKQHEYLLIYSKNPLPANALNFEKSDERIDEQYKYKDKNGKYRLTLLTNGHKEFDKFNRPNLYFPLYVNSKDFSVSETADKDHIEVVYPNGNSVWTWSSEKVKNEKDKLLAVKQKDDSWKIYRKIYSTDDNGNVVTEKPKSVWNDSIYYTKNGQKELSDIFPGTDKRNFPHPKPLNYIKKIISLIPNKNATILDFFAGSGTTGHAVMELNKDDNGNRKCILCQWDDKNDICNSITYKKLKTLTTGKRDDGSIYGQGYKCNWKYYDIKLIGIQGDKNLQDGRLDIHFEFCKWYNWR